MTSRIDSAPRRIREIEDAFGTCLRLWVEPHREGGIILMERGDLPASPRVMLDVFGAEMLSAMILSARMATPADIPEETIDGRFPARFDLVNKPAPAIRLSAADAMLEVPAGLWDRVFVELTLAATVVRELSRRPWTIH